MPKDLKRIDLQKDLSKDRKRWRHSSSRSEPTLTLIYIEKEIDNNGNASLLFYYLPFIRDLICIRSVAFYSVITGWCHRRFHITIKYYIIRTIYLPFIFFLFFFLLLHFDTYSLAFILHSSDCTDMLG